MLEAILNLLGGIFAFAGHIGGGSSFPEPLSPEEERECLARLEKGDLRRGGCLLNITFASWPILPRNTLRPEGTPMTLYP